MFYYIDDDNLLVSQNIDISYLNSKNYLSLFDSTTIHFNNKIVIATNDATVLNTIGTVTDEGNYYNISLDSTLYISLPFLNDNIRDVADNTDNPFNKNKILLYFFRLYSEKNLYFNLNSDEYVTYKKPTINNNPILDFVMIDETDVSYFINNNENVSYAYNEHQISLEREIFYSIRDEYLPDYLFKCTSGSDIKYYKIYLDEKYTGVSGSKFYDMTTIEDMTTYTDSDFYSVKNLPLLLKNANFRKYFNEKLSNFDTVDIIFRIKNTSDTIPELNKDVRLYKNNQYIKFLSMIKLRYNLHFNNLNQINEYSSHVQFVNIKSSDIQTLFDNIDVIFNDDIVDFYKYSDNGVIYDTTNYVNINNYIYELKYDLTNTNLDIVIKNISSDNLDFPVDDIIITLNRNMSDTYINNILFNSNDNDFLFTNNSFNMYYLMCSYETDFTDNISILNTLIAEDLFDISCSLLGIDVVDLTSKMDILSNIELKTQFIQNNNTSHMFYFEFNKSSYNGYLYKYILNDYIKLLSDSFMISFYSIKNGIVYKYNMKLTNDLLLKHLISEDKDIYIYKILDVGIVLYYNNIYNQDKYESWFIDLYNQLIGDSIYNNFSIDN